MKQIIFLLILFFSFSAFAQNRGTLCAKIEVTGGGQVEAGSSMSFTANVTGLTKNSTIEYEWNISAGIIASGQGTRSIVVDTTGVPGATNITAEVKVKGLHDFCANAASEIGSVAPKLIGDPFDNFGKQSGNDVKARIQNLYVALDNYSTAQGYIINYGTDEEIIAREKQIQRAINFLKLDANRVMVVRGGENPRGEAGAWTIVWIVPPGAELPQP